VTPASFPVRTEPGRRYLVDAADRPFLLHGDTAWSLIAQLRRDDVDLYLEDRRARRFNTLLVNLLEARFATNAPANSYGDQPFLTPDDYSTPNERYFAHADWVLERAAEEGFLILLAPSYMGHGGGGEGWYHAMERMGPERLRDYGRYLGGRYREFTNIVWVHGGDYNPPTKELADAIAEGIAERMPSVLQTAHPGPETPAVAHWGDRPWLALNNVYTYGDVHRASIKQYQRSRLPFFLIEAVYENEHEATAERLRAQAYQAVLSGATGQLFGNNPLWHFDGPGLFAADPDWKQALGSPGTESMTHLHELLSRYAWWALRPDARPGLLSKRIGHRRNRPVAAVADDRSFAVVYLPRRATLRLDLRTIAGSKVALTWYDPSDGRAAVAPESPIPASGRVDLTPTGANAAGDADWVLILEAA
jgi:hypothetical protein